MSPPPLVGPPRSTRASPVRCIRLRRTPALKRQASGPSTARGCRFARARTPRPTTRPRQRNRPPEPGGHWNEAQRQSRRGRRKQLECLLAYAPRETRTPTGHMAHKALNFGLGVSERLLRSLPATASAVANGLDGSDGAFVVTGVVTRTLAFTRKQQRGRPEGGACFSSLGASAGPRRRRPHPRECSNWKTERPKRNDRSIGCTGARS